MFIDAHVEVNVNWLPPLLEPIALNPKVITTPIIDSFRYDTFEYRKLDDGGRGIFNWDLQYRRFPRRPEDIRPDEPIPSPVMVLNNLKSFIIYFFCLHLFSDWISFCDKSTIFLGYWSVRQAIKGITR